LSDDDEVRGRRPCNTFVTRSDDDPAVGLHRHQLDARFARVVSVEAVGTFLLVLTIISTAIAGTLSKPVAGPSYNSLAIPLAGGLSLACLVTALGPISGAHLNPAVTLGVAINGRVRWRYAPAYVAAQFVGAVGAALLAWVLYGPKARSVAGLGATYPAAGVTPWRVFGTEAVVTFPLVAVVVVVGVDRRVPSGVAGITIGFALAAAILLSGPLTGGGVNPARAIGPMIPAGKFTDWWAYIIGPLLGGVAAALACRPLIHQANPEEDSEARFKCSN